MRRKSFGWLLGGGGTRKSITFAGTLAALFIAGTVSAVEINDLLVSPPDAPRVSSNPLGLPSFLWWALGVLLVSFLVMALRRSRLPTRWLDERFCEPSTYLAIAIFLACGGLFLGSLSLDPVPMGQGLLLAATVFAFLGMIGKDREGPLL